jgi:hypothetical protein
VNARLGQALEVYLEWTLTKASAFLVVPMLVWEYVKDEPKEES